MKFQHAKSIINQHRAANDELVTTQIKCLAAEARVASLSDDRKREELETIESELRFVEERRLRLIDEVATLRDQLSRPNLELRKAQDLWSAVRAHRDRLAKRVALFAGKLDAANARVAEIGQLEAAKAKKRAEIIEMYKQQAASDQTLTAEQRAKIDYERMADAFLANVGKLTPQELGGQLTEARSK